VVSAIACYISKPNEWLWALRGGRSAKRESARKGTGIEPQLLMVLPDELLESRVRAQRSKIRTFFDGRKIAVTKVESLLQLSQGFLFVAFRSVGGA
jgi:hypothetical protein